MKNQIKLTESNLHDLMYSSWRYFIGRQSIQALTQADVMRDIITNNPKSFPRDRRKFDARDVRWCINHRMNHYSNITVTGRCDDDDALDMLVSYLESVDKAEEYVNSHSFRVDLTEKTVTETDEPIGTMPISLNIIQILGPWCKFANWLDPHHVVTIGTPDGTQDYTCARWPASDSQSHISIRYMNVDSAGGPGVYLNPELIKHVEQYGDLLPDRQIQ